MEAEVPVVSLTFWVNSSSEFINSGKYFVSIIGFISTGKLMVLNMLHLLGRIWL